MIDRPIDVSEDNISGDAAHLTSSSQTDDNFEGGVFASSKDCWLFHGDAVHSKIDVSGELTLSNTITVSPVNGAMTECVIPHVVGEKTGFKYGMTKLFKYFLVISFLVDLIEPRQYPQAANQKFCKGWQVGKSSPTENCQIPKYPNTIQCGLVWYGFMMVHVDDLNPHLGAVPEVQEAPHKLNLTVETVEMRLHIDCSAVTLG